MAAQPDCFIHFKLSPVVTHEGLSYQILSIELATRDRLITPENLMSITLPPGIDGRAGIILSGRAPIWLYGYLVHELHPVAWVACFDPRLGAIVVATHTPGVQIGQVIPLEQLSNGSINPDALLCPAVLIVGPPNSGKSILAFRLFEQLSKLDSHIYLQRAHWDGEGNYTLDGYLDGESREALKAQNRGKLSSRFFPVHAQAILNLRQQKSLVLVDVGGMVQPEKLPLLEACSHYLPISADPKAVAPWHEFCHGRGNLKLLGVIHSSLEEGVVIHQTEPAWEITVGPWIEEIDIAIPQPILDSLQAIMRPPDQLMER